MESKKVTIISALGAGLEYYDFIIYGLLAGYLSNEFFPAGDYLISLLATFGIFAVGYFVRPLGGIIFGMIGDKYGRKNTFMISILIMAFSTILMGLMPPFSYAGYSAPVIFALLRGCQGISFGAELPGSLTFISEHVGKKYRGFQCSFVTSFIAAGVAFGTLLVYIITFFLSKSAMQEWGWRIPFLLGGTLAFVAYFIRKKTSETPHFENMENHSKNAFWELIKNYPREIFTGLGIILFPASFIIFCVSIPSYFNKVFGFTPQNIFLTLTIGYIWSMISAPIFGYISDIIGRKKLYFISILFFIISSKFLFGLIEYNTTLLLIVFIIIYQTFISGLSASYLPLLAENFPTQVRYTGVAFCYNIVFAVSGTVPFLVNYLYKVTHHPYAFLILLLTFSIISLICIILTKDYTGEVMRD